MKKLLIALFTLILTACGGGSSNDDGPPSDACNLISSPAKIINGTTCQTSRSAIVRISIGDASCSGTLVTPNQVLTAGHCVHDLTSIATIRAGTISPSKFFVFRANSQVPIAKVAKVTSHPDFQNDWIAYVFGKRKANRQYLDAILVNGVADLAVLELDRSLSIVPQPISGSNLLVAGQIIGIFGYGATDGNKPAFTDNLNSGKMSVAEIGKDNITTIFQKGDGNTCFGDSGGPALNTVGVPSIIATTTLGTANNCRLGEVSLFTLLSSPRLSAFIRRTAPLAEFL